MVRGERNLLLDAIYVVGRRGMRIALIAGMTVAAALVFEAVRGLTYTASVRVLVAPTAEAGAEREGRTARNQVEVLRDPGLVKQLVTGPASEGPALSSAVALRAAQGLRVRALGDTDVIGLALTWDDRVGAADMLNRIVAGYQRAVQGADEARDGLRRAQAGLEDAQAELNAVDAGLASGQPPADSEVWRAERTRAEQALAARRQTADGVRLERALAQRKLEGIEATFRSGGWVDGGDADPGAIGPAPLAAGFSVLLEKRQSLLTDGKADTAEMRALDREIARVRTQSFATARQISAARVAALDDRLAQLGREVAEDEAALLAVDRRGSEGEVLRESRAVKVRRVAEERLRVDAARLQMDVPWQGVASVRVLSEARPPSEPDWPAPAVVVRMAAGAGLCLGLASAVWAEWRRRTLDRPGDVTRALGLEVLARLEDMPVARLP